MRKVLKYVAVIPLALTAGLTLSVPSMAEDKPKGEWTHDYCKKDNAQCGGVVYANGGGYVVKSVTLTAKGDNDQDAGFNPECLGIDKKLDANLALGEFDLFVVPTTCKYRLMINIKSGDKERKNVKVTPACVLVTISKGTTKNDNRIKFKKRDYKFPDGMDDATKDQLKALGDKECKVL